MSVCWLISIYLLVLNAKTSPFWGEVFAYMVHSGGFEPPTARFVAGYSIQLSYECFAVSFQRPRTIGGQGCCVNNP